MTLVKALASRCRLLHVHVPYRQLEATFSFLLEHRLQPEIAFKGPDLDRLSLDALRYAGRQLAAAGLACTVHAPFMDLNPGALEPLVFAATRHRFAQSLNAAEALGARLVVFHPGYDPWKYGGQDHLWLEQNQLFWPPLLDQAAQAGCRMALENIFEVRTDTLTALLDSIDSPLLGHCFDIGHWHLFAKVPLAEWFAALGSRLSHLHLHDNFGKHDEHLPVGEGRIDFASLFSLIATLPQQPTMTLEAHSQEALLRSLNGVCPHLLPTDGGNFPFTPS
jgi:sugar phosphate isomerase/epimerase